MGKMFLQVISFEEGWHFLINPMAWITGLSVVFTVFSNLANLNATLRLYSQLMVMPTYECCIILGTLLSGGIVMNEFSYYGTKQLLTIFCGTSIAFVGIMYKICMLEINDEVRKELDTEK